LVIALGGSSYPIVIGLEPLHLSIDSSKHSFVIGFCPARGEILKLLYDLVESFASGVRFGEHIERGSIASLDVSGEGACEAGFSGATEERGERW
jgi:hypothetical protein